ncbi:MAG: hypothetical protein GF418_14290 [Chitinivibrionales bacterium]|nr:hypothetical protein [Chitinivibrionales bacterium]MBD3396789.1 hypothetical protein [Chitinivibrionales bacterium]
MMPAPCMSARPWLPPWCIWHPVSRSGDSVPGFCGRTMLDRMHIGDKTIAPALVCAPMAGITHSAFRRLLADFGGYGALHTEMLSGDALLHEDLARSPFTKRRACEGIVFFQLALSGRENIEAVVGRLASANPGGIDLNLGCPAPDIRKAGAGIALFSDLDRLDSVLARIRGAWNGALTVKCRLGSNPQDWKPAFEERLRVFERHGIHALTVHPRFFKEKLKRTARREHFAWIASRTRIPIIANGDIVSPNQLSGIEGASAVMLGRIAAARPWVFREFSGERVAPDYGGVWEGFCDYVLEDFAPEKAIGRIKEFAAYYSRNFFFGHELYRAAQGARGLDQLRERVRAFLSRNPRTVRTPSFGGV